MGLVAGIWLLVLGVLGASTIIIAKKPDAKQMIDKLGPYQGWIGAVSALWGVWILIHALLNLRLLSAGLRPMIWWFTLLANGFLQATLGLLLGVAILKTFTSNEEALDRLDQTVAKLTPWQGKLGLAALGLGIWVILGSFILL